MAQKVQVTLVDDLDGSSADETLTFGLDGVAYEIDLSRSNAKKFRDSLNAYVGAARRSGPSCPRWSSAWACRSPARSRQPGTHVRHPGLGTNQGHQGQRARPHLGRRGRQIRGRSLALHFSCSLGAQRAFAALRNTLVQVTVETQCGHERPFGRIWRVRRRKLGLRTQVWPAFGREQCEDCRSARQGLSPAPG